MPIFNTKIKNKRFRSIVFLLVLGMFSVISVTPKIANTKTAKSLFSLNKQEKDIQKEVDTNTFPKSSERKPLYTQWVVATAYSSEVGQTDSSPCIPAMGGFNLCKNYEDNKVEDTIAANFLPLGAKVKFPNKYDDKIFTVRDRMNSRYDGTNRIDFWKSQTPEAENFGVKSLKMEIVTY